ncbi:hypothetical protein N657DRAFT_275453 [Parathielavia appendiculata]|uniref:Uncharacterized protein n=1 Tax=Parathielavia appendiculata TaxID=2587402 RepID=A0AAN6U3D8_9PEZI|nr:hypothetical protein N657DRAFT_275453 [Parathielavia appendiculata]
MIGLVLSGPGKSQLRCGNPTGLSKETYIRHLAWLRCRWDKFRGMPGRIPPSSYVVSPSSFSFHSSFFFLLAYLCYADGKSGAHSNSSHAAERYWRLRGAKRWTFLGRFCGVTSPKSGFPSRHNLRHLQSILDKCWRQPNSSLAPLKIHLLPNREFAPNTRLRRFSRCGSVSKSLPVPVQPGLGPKAATSRVSSCMTKCTAVARLISTT